MQRDLAASTGALDLSFGVVLGYVCIFLGFSLHV